MIERAFHGGDVRGIARARGRDAADFIDFSANINPLGPPRAVSAVFSGYLASGALAHYPEPGLPELAAALARARSVAPDNITIHAGSAALFDAILRACAPRRLGLCVPAFAEYARAATANGIPVEAYRLDALADEPFVVEHIARWARAAQLDALLLTNPHNPLGFGVPATAMRELRARLDGVMLIVDEAFADYDESVSIAIDAAHDSGTIVVRSLTKFYAMPDLRVGYAVTTADVARRLSRFIPAWPVSGIAAAAATAALLDGGYAAHVQTRNEHARAQLARGLAALGLRVLPAAANFVTFEITAAANVADALLAQHRIIVRDCASFAGLPADRYLRVAVRDGHDNARLLEALAKEKPAASSAARNRRPDLA